MAVEEKTAAEEEVTAEEETGENAESGDGEEAGEAAESESGEEADEAAESGGGEEAGESQETAAGENEQQTEILLGDSAALRESGAILVNREGKRFVNELEADEAVGQAILAQTDSVSYLVFDRETADTLSEAAAFPEDVSFTESDTVEGLAKKLGLDPEELVVTMEFYAGYQETGTDPEFGRENMASELVTPDFYAIRCLAAKEAGENSEIGNH